MSNQNPVPVLTSSIKAQLGVETTWGTAVVQTIALGSVSVSPKPKISTEKFIALGYRLPFVQALSEKMAEHGFEGMATYTELGYFLKTLASQASGTVDAYTLAAGGKTWPGAAVSALSLKGDNKVVNVSGTILSKWFNETAPTAGLTPPAQDVIDQSEVVLSLRGSTLTRWFNWGLDLANIVDLFRFGGATEPGAVTAPALDASFSVEFEKNATNEALLASLEDVLAFEIACTKTDPAHTFSITGKAQIADIIEFKDNGGIYGYGLKLNVMADGADGITVTSS
jgi:hypothetical protein